MLISAARRSAAPAASSVSSLISSNWLTAFLIAACSDGLRTPEISTEVSSVLAMCSPPFVFCFTYWRPGRFLLCAFPFFGQILGRLGIFKNKVYDWLFFEVGGAGVVHSGVVSVCSSESLSGEALSDASIKFRPICITSTTSCPLIRSMSEKS